MTKTYTWDECDCTITEGTATTVAIGDHDDLGWQRGEDHGDLKTFRNEGRLALEVEADSEEEANDKFMTHPEYEELMA